MFLLLTKVKLYVKFLEKNALINVWTHTYNIYNYQHSKISNQDNCSKALKMENLLFEK
jgi:hypothetical protein